LASGERRRCSNEAKTRNQLKFAGLPKLANGSQPLVGRSSPASVMEFGFYCSSVCLSVCMTYRVKTIESSTKIFGRPFVLSVRPALSVCNVGVLWPSGCMDQDETRHRGRPRPQLRYVRWGLSSPSLKGHSPHPPNFRPISVVAKQHGG